MFRSLRYRNFRLFFFGQLLSLCGSWMQSTAIGWLLYRLTRDPFMLGVGNFINQFPVFVLGFLAGAMVDRFNRWRIVLVMQAVAMVQAAVLAALTLSGRVQVWHLFALSFVLGVVYAFEIPARQVMIGELVEPQDRPNAIALNSTIVNGTRIVAPAFAGILIGWVGEGWCFAANSLSYLSVLAGLLLMRDLKQAPSQFHGSQWEELGRGLGYAIGHDGIRAILLLIAVFSLVGLPLYVLLPVFADAILKAGPRGLGLLSSAAGVGATVGALALAGRGSSTGIARWILDAALLYGLAMAGLAFSSRLALSCGLMLLVGVAAIVLLAGSNALLQELSSDRYRGRVMAFYSMVFIGLSPVGAFLVGGIAARAGVRKTVLAQALLCAAIAFVYRRRLPDLIDSSLTAESAALRPPPEVV